MSFTVTMIFICYIFLHKSEKIKLKLNKKFVHSLKGHVSVILKPIRVSEAKYNLIQSCWYQDDLICKYISTNDNIQV